MHLQLSSFFWSLTVLTLCVSRVLALLPSGAIFPLYIYPEEGCNEWSAVTSSIQSNSNVQFIVVINPNSGPGEPDSNYQSCVASLRTAGMIHGNLKVVGYVPTDYGSTPSAEVISMIDTYSQWPSASRPDGIFFDEVSESASDLALYEDYASQVHSDFGTSLIILNPGTNPETSAYFDIADIIVTFEDVYDNFDSSTSLVVSSSTPAHKQAVLLLDGPAELPLSIVNELAGTIGVGASFITDFSEASAYDNIPTYWSTFISDLIDVQT